LYNLWWKERGGAGKCDTAEPNNKDANELGVENVGGVFVVLLGGLALSTIVAVIEFIWKARKNADEDKVRKRVGIVQTNLNTKSIQLFTVVMVSQHCYCLNEILSTHV
jgi:hypothetical protein